MSQRTRFRYTCAKCGAAATKSSGVLGTWRCTGGCPYYRPVRVPRITGSGKECEFDMHRNPQVEDVPVRRHIKVHREVV
jgi:hypothetical protein